ERKSCLLRCARKARDAAAQVTRDDPSGVGSRARCFSAGGVCLRNRGQADLRPDPRTARKAVPPQHRQAPRLHSRACEKEAAAFAESDAPRRAPPGAIEDATTL